MNNIVIPSTYNYIGCFLTFKCNLHCSYCLNHQYGAKQKYEHMSPQQWIDGLNRIVTRDDLPITLQGGEPSMYKGLYEILANVNRAINIDMLTNGTFFTQDFIDNVKPERLKRKAKYASIRISYHPEQMSLDATVKKVKKLQDAGFSVGVWIVNHPAYTSMTVASQDIMIKEGIDCRLKEFLGEYKNKFYGTYKYPDSVDNYRTKTVMCKPSEMLIAPNGRIYQCHGHLYANQPGYAHILDDNVTLLNEHKLCDMYGLCNSCDQKLKTDRFQQNGWCSVDILELDK